MELGVLVNIEWPPDEIRAVARAAIEYGFKQIWVNEHPLELDPFLVLEDIAVRPESLEDENGERTALGIGTINPWARHPGVIAASAATLASLNKVHFSLGIGSGAPPLFPPIGLELDNVVSGCSDAVAAIKRLVAGDQVTTKGQTFAMEGAKLPSGLDMDVSVLLGVSGGPRMLRVAGAVADGIILPAGNHQYYRSMLSDYFEARPSTHGSDRSPSPEIVVNGNLLLEAENTEPVEARARHLVAHALSYRAKTSIHALTRMQLSKETAQDWADNPDSIPREFLFESVIGGPADRCAEQLEELDALGVTQFVLRFPTVDNVRRVGESILPILAPLP